MRGNLAKALIGASAIALTMLLLSACATRPVASWAPACAAWKPIDAVATHDDIFLIIVANEHAMRPLTDEINGNNKSRAENCK